MKCTWPGDYHSLSLSRIQLIPHRSHHTLTLFRSRFIDCNSYSLSRRWHNSFQCGVVEPLFHCREKLRGVQEEQLRIQNTFLRQYITLTRLLRQPSTTTYCDRLKRNCVRTDKLNTQPPQSRAWRESLDGWPNDNRWPHQKTSTLDDVIARNGT